MAITSLDEAHGGLQRSIQFAKATSTTLTINTPFSLFYLNGFPGAAAAPTPGLAGAALTTYAGQLPFTNPVSGNTHLMNLEVLGNGATCTLLVCDRLWHNSGLDPVLTTAQTVNSVTFPARDANGTSDGEQVLIGIERSNPSGSSSVNPVVSMSYTNQSGTGGRTGNILTVTGSGIFTGDFHFMGLQAGDTGVRSIQTFTFTNGLGGTFHLVAFRVLARLEVIPGKMAAIDWLTGGAVRLFNDTVPFLVIIPTATTSTSVHGELTLTQG